MTAQSEKIRWGGEFLTEEEIKVKNRIKEIVTEKPAEISLLLLGRILRAEGFDSDTIRTGFLYLANTEALSITRERAVIFDPE